jgi:hypothetical protein
VGFTGPTSIMSSLKSVQHLWTARHNAELCRRREVVIAGKRPIDVQHRSYATTAVLMSVAFLEATVNEVFEDATDDRHVGQRVELLEPRVRAMLASFWEQSGTDVTRCSANTRWLCCYRALGNLTRALSHARTLNSSLTSAMASCTSDRTGMTQGRSASSIHSVIAFIRAGF